MEFKIEKNVMLPNAGRRETYPFVRMAVGESFAFAANLYPKIVSAAWWAGKRNEMKFSIRRDGAGYRVWRIA